MAGESGVGHAVSHMCVYKCVCVCIYESQFDPIQPMHNLGLSILISTITYICTCGPSNPETPKAQPHPPPPSHINTHTDGRRLGPDADKALEWLEKAGSQLQPDHPNSSSPSQPEVAELWYARALACRRVDQGLAARGVTAAVDGDEEEGGDGWEEEVETERYGARTGVEFVRVVRRRANRLKRARCVCVCGRGWVGGWGDGWIGGRVWVGGCVDGPITIHMFIHAPPPPPHSYIRICVTTTGPRSRRGRRACRPSTGARCGGSSRRRRWGTWRRWLVS